MNTHPPVDVTRKLVFLYVIHELLLIDSNKSSGGGDENMWEKYRDFRATVGELVLLPAIDSIRLDLLQNLRTPTYNNSNTAISQVDTICERFRNMREMWKDVDCFDSPTLTNDISRAISLMEKDVQTAKDNVGISSPPKLVDASMALEKHNTVDDSMDTGYDEQDSFGQISTSEPPANEENMDDDVSCGTAIEEGIDEGTTTGLDVAVTITDLAGPIAENFKTSLLPMKRKGDFDDEVVVSPEESPSRPTIMEPDDRAVDDWEPEFITLGNVQIQELDIPCKAIATMQITRDLHGESMARLSALVSTIPQSVMDSCRAILDSNTSPADTFKSVEIPGLPDELLDIDLDGALASLRLYKDIVMKQKEARKKCIELLIKCQCELGFSCKEAAQRFYTIDSKLMLLNKKKEKIRDAMELEGLDFEGLQNDDDNDRDDDTPTEFSWFKKGDMNI
jgi:hypothetical protein